MASTNKTSNLQLSQFIATDTPTWLVDYNGDMEKIDAGVGRVEELAETASTQAVGVASGLQTTNQTVTTLSGQVANVQTQANSTTASVNGINQKLGNADISGISDGTITGAISMQNSKLPKYIDITVQCPASTWCNIPLPEVISSVNEVINVHRPNEADSNVYGVIWWPSANKQITILRVNTNDTNLAVDNTEKTIKLRIWYC